MLTWACLVLAVALPAATLTSLLQAAPQAMLAQLGVGSPTGASLASPNIAVWQHIAVVCVSLLPVAAIAYALWRASQCFGGFVRGETFSLATVRHLRGFAAGLLVSSCAGLAVPTFVVWLLTLNAPAGERILTVSLGTQQLLMLLFAGIVWQMSHAMTRAVELAQDNAQIV